jgi:hypothetical protein
MAEFEDFLSFFSSEKIVAVASGLLRFVGVATATPSGFKIF